MNITQKLILWEKEKLISPFQHQSIIDYEKRSGGSKFFLYAMLLSAFCIGLGLIALISANWTQIPSWLKLFCDFALLFLGAGMVCYYASKNKAQHFESTILFYAILIVASIGLFGQIYQLQSADWQAYMLWSILAIPLVLMTRRAVLPFIWLPIFFYGLFSWLMEMSWFSNAIYFWSDVYPLAIVLMFGLCLLSFQVLIEHLAVNFWSAISKALGIWFWIGGFCLLLSMDFAASWWRADFADLPLVIFLSSLLFVWISTLYALSRIWYQSRLWMIFWGLILCFSFIENLPLNSGLFSEIIGFMLTAIVLVVAMFYAYRHNLTKIMNWAAVLFAIRLFIVFLDKFGNLNNTALGLMLCGLVFLGLAFGVRIFIRHNQQGVANV